MAATMPLDDRSHAGLSLEAWADLGEDEEGELVNGRLVEEEMPSFLHETVVSWLIMLLGAWVMPRGGWVFGSEAKLGIVALQRGRKPDVTMFLPGSRPPRRNASMATEPPDVVIEVLSTRPRDRRRDRIEKVEDYATFGVRFYWLVDPHMRGLEIFELDLSDRRYKLVLAGAEGTYRVPGCEGLTLNLDDLWAAVDSLPDGEEDEPGSGET